VLQEDLGTMRVLQGMAMEELVGWFLSQGSTLVQLTSWAKTNMNRVTVGTPALSCDCHVQTKLEVGCEWSP